MRRGLRAGGAEVRGADAAILTRRTGVRLAAVGGEVELVEGDVRSYARTHAATQGVDCVIPA